MSHARWILIDRLSGVVDESHRAWGAGVPRGWKRRVMHDHSLSVLFTDCTSDADCQAYKDWDALRSAHEDDIEAEHLRGAKA